ncbi:major facilitator superfamily domain-containing protein [Schizophyllum amplum]|uniref:Major facilitator superfamily domain-containing protein n=1 Tax=Schizophyllum amplum TaxID=97359 RepID=A0A550CRS1_9AGAR|nr:major facilitator superfamily domain-containing protein [Auriculariopsis ampla]
MEAEERNANHVDEEAPLLDAPRGRRVKSRQHLKSQLIIVMLLQICSPITSQSIYPYINQLIREIGITGGDDRKVGYYAGLIESLFFVTEALTVLQWSRVSDYIGRKPVLLLGMFGTIVSMLCFGLSTTFWQLVISRCFCGFLNGNIGVMKSIMGDLTDPSNRAEVFAYLPVVWGLGATLGPFFGGWLARPHDRWPHAFAAQFWQDYPYFFPCLITASYVVFAFTITAIFFREVRIPTPTDLPSHSTPRRRSPVDTPSSPACAPTLRELLTFPVVISIANYVALAFIEIMELSLLPLFLAMPLSIGGLNLAPDKIGYILGSYGVATGAFQALFFARITRRFGVRAVFITGMAAFVPMTLAYPIASALAKTAGGVTPAVWMLVGSIVLMLCVMDLAYGTIFMFVTASVPNQNALGATNGVAQTFVSISRAIGPAAATSMYSFSLEHNILGGNAVYVLLLVLSVISLRLASYLPPNNWDETATYEAPNNHEEIANGRSVAENANRQDE